MNSVADYVPLVPAIVFSVAIFVVLRVYRGSKKIQPLENGLTPLFQEQAGGRFDFYNLTFPFVRHAIYDEFVVIATYNRYYKLNFNQISSFEVKRHIASTGVTYHHNVSDIPKKIVVWSTNPDWVGSLLASKGIGN